MKTLIFPILFLLFFQSLVLAEKKEDDKKKPKKELKLFFATTHSSFSNWQGGGVNSLVFSCKLDGVFRKVSSRWDYEHDVELGIGILKQEDTDLQKSEDLIHYSYSLGYSPKKEGRFAFLLNLDLRTQFTDGYNYKKNPFEESGELPVKVSSIFSPAYLTESINISYKIDKWFRSSLGFGLKQIIVTQSSLRELYGVEKNKEVRFEYGISSKLKLKKELIKNVNVDSQFDLFLVAGQTKNPDIRWNNKFNLKVNSWLQIRFEFEMFYDDDILDKLQIREVMSIGVILNILGLP